MVYDADMSSPPSAAYSPTVRRKRLSRELIALREKSGLTPAQVAAHFDRDRNWINRIENGTRKRPHIAEIASLLDLYGVTEESAPEQRAAVLELTRQARQRGWWDRYGDVLDTEGYVGLEVEASLISTYQPQVLPGLLQTADYTAESARAAINPSAEVDRVIHTRAERQKILTRGDPPRVWAVIDEAVLARGASESVMRAQIARLIELSELPNVTIQILPFSAGMHAGMHGPFVLLEFPEDTPVVFLESRRNSIYLEDPGIVDEYRTILGHIQTSALTAVESANHLKRLI